MSRVVSPAPRRRDRNPDEDGFKLRQIPVAFASIPRVMKLVLSASTILTVLMGLLSILQGFMPALSIEITRIVVNSVEVGIRQHSINPIWFPVGLQLAVVLVTSLLSTLGNIVQQLLQERVSNKIQLLVLEKSNTLDLSFFEDSEFYDKLRQATDQSTYKPVSMISQTFDLFRTMVTLFSVIAILLQLEWWLAIIALVIPIPAFISSAKYGWIGYQRMRRQSPERRTMSYIQSLMTTDTYNKEIKLFTLGNFFITRFVGLANKFYDENKTIVIRRYLMNFVWTGLTGAANTGIYLYVAIRAVTGSLGISGLIAYTQAAVQAGQSFQNLLNGISNTYENNLYINTLFDFLEYQPKIVSPALPERVLPDAAMKGLSIEFRDVSFTYPGKDPETQAALKHVSFTIQAGESVALVGRNGAGKTTMVKLLTRLYDPDDGAILIGGRNIKEYDLKELREQVGVIFQDYVTYFMSARENIGVGRIAEIENRELVTSAAGKSGANTVIEKLPEQYDTMLGKWFDKGMQLSGGEWQKVALARAFMRDARILILDEPTSSLDAQAESEVFSHFRALTAGKTAFFISHRFSTVRLADKIFVLENGTILENGSHKELMQLDGRYAELFNLQAEAYR